MPLYMSKPTQMYYNTSGIDENRKQSTVAYSLNCVGSEKSLVNKPEDALSIVEEESETEVTGVDEGDVSDDEEGEISNESEQDNENDVEPKSARENDKICVDSECQTEENEPTSAPVACTLVSRMTSCGDLESGKPVECVQGDASNQVTESSKESHDLVEIIGKQSVQTSPYLGSIVTTSSDADRKGDGSIGQPIAKLSREASILRAKSLEEKKIQLRKIFRETSQMAAIFHKPSKHVDFKIVPNNRQPVSEKTPNPPSNTRPQSRKPHLSPVAGRGQPVNNATTSTTATRARRSQSRSPSTSPPPPSSRLRDRRNVSPRTQLTLQKCDPVITPKAEAIKTTIEEQLKRTSPTRAAGIGGSPASVRPQSPSSLPRGHPLEQGVTLEEFRVMRKGVNQNQIRLNNRK